jgi:YesN/AraC family two-component response regulator
VVDRLGDEIDIVISDVVMPNMSGIQLAEYVLARYPRMGMILLSGYTAETLNVEHIIALGARFVSKPVATRDLLQAIREVVANRARAPIG